MVLFLLGKLHGDLLWARAGPSEPKEQRESACARASSDGAIRGGPIKTGCYFLQWHSGPNGLWKQSQVTNLSVVSGISELHCR